MKLAYFITLVVGLAAAKSSDKDAPHVLRRYQKLSDFQLEEISQYCQSHGNNYYRVPWEAQKDCIIHKLQELRFEHVDHGINVAERPVKRA